MIARLFFLLVTIAALCASAMAVDMTDNQVAFYLRGAEEKELLEEVNEYLQCRCFLVYCHCRTLTHLFSLSLFVATRSSLLQVWGEDAMFWKRQMEEYDSMSFDRRLEAYSMSMSM